MVIRPARVLGRSRAAAQPVAAAQPGGDSASRALRGSVAPTMGYNVGAQLLHFAFGVALARLLPPEDFGLLGMTLVFAQLGGVVAMAGLPQALIQTPDLSPTQCRAAYTLSIGLAAAVGGVLMLAAPAIASFFGNPVVADLMWLMALNFVLNGAGTVPYVLLNRELRLRELARIDPIAAVVGGMASVFLAWRGYGVWALAAGVPISSATRLALYHLYTRWAPRPGFSWGSLRGFGRYSVGATGTFLFRQLTAVMDFLLIGRVLSPFALGIYMRALRLVTIPQTQFSMVVGRLLFPYFSRIQEDAERIRRNLLRATCATALLVLPVLLLLALVARDFITVVYGSRWVAAALPLQILCVTGGVRAISHFARPVLDARGYVRVQALFQGVYAAALLAAILYAARWGIVGVAGALAVCSLLLDLALLALLRRAVDLPLSRIGASLVPGLAAAAAALAGAGFVVLLTPDGAPAAVRLPAALAGGVAAALALLEVTPFGRRNAAYADVRAQLCRLGSARLRDPAREGAR